MIGSLVTRGFGNGDLIGEIHLAVTAGYSISNLTDAIGYLESETHVMNSLTSMTMVTNSLTSKTEVL